MKSFAAAAVAVLALGAPTLALAESVFDPAEGAFVTRPATSSTGTSEAARADMDRYTETRRIWDPAEGEFVVVKVAPGTSGAAVATNDGESRPMRRVWDPAEGEFMMVPAN
jgi:hypothetical protein